MLLLGHGQPRDVLQVDDPVDVAGEHQPIVALEDVVGGHRHDHALVTIDLHQVHAL